MRLLGKVGDVGEIGVVGLGQQSCGGVAVEQFEYPAQGDVLDDQGQFRERRHQQIVQLVDEPGALADHGLQARGRLAQDAQRGRPAAMAAGGPFADGKAGRGACLDGVGLAGGEESGCVVLLRSRSPQETVMSRPANGEAAGGADAEAVEEVQEIVGVLPGDIQADDEAGGGVAVGQPFETHTELGVAVGGFGEGQLGGGLLEVVRQEGGVVAVARGVDADADATGGTACPFRERVRS